MEGVRGRIRSTTGIPVKWSDPSLQISNLVHAVVNTMDVLSSRHGAEIAALNSHHADDMAALHGKYNALHFMCKSQTWKKWRSWRSRTVENSAKKLFRISFIIQNSFQSIRNLWKTLFRGESLSRSRPVSH